MPDLQDRPPEPNKEPGMLGLQLKLDSIGVKLIRWETVFSAKEHQKVLYISREGDPHPEDVARIIANWRPPGKITFYGSYCFGKISGVEIRWIWCKE